MELCCRLLLEVTKVKQAGKALEIAVVGLGQAGGNLAAEMSRRGYSAMALNTASTDLSAFEAEGASIPSELRVYIGLDGHDGAGADASYGRECIDAHAELIRDRVSQHVAGADVVLLTAGLGGGTGSAVGDLIRALGPLSLPLVVMATLPNEHESGIAKVNAVKAINVIVKENLLGWVFVDNSRLAQANGDVALDRYFPVVNKQICEPIDAFNGLNAREDYVPIRALDGEDFRALLLSGGILNVASVSLPQLNVETVMQGVRDAIQYSAVMPEGFSIEQLSYLGLVLEGPAASLEQMSFAAFEQVSEQLKTETGGAAVYLGVYRAPEGAPTQLRLICSTHSLPSGIQEIVTSAKREGGQLRDKLQQTLSGLDLGEIEEYELFRTSPGARRRLTDAPPESRLSFPPRVKPSQAPKATQESSAVAAAASGGVDSIAPKKTASSGATAADSPTSDREAYDRMVKEYQDASSEEVRSKVASRLETDRKSDNSLIRYYAVRAMTKLGTDVFVDALKAAAEDEDATVRAVASKALQAHASQ